MGRFLDVLAVLLGWIIHCSNGTVTLSVINSVDGVNTLECNTEVILVCKVDPYSQLINWQVNSTLYAMCSPGCMDNPPFPGNYSFTFDVTNGVFNTTINQVTFSDSSTEFSCDDGSTSDSVTTEVVPAYSENVTYVNDERDQIVFTTACVNPDVNFKWFTVKSDNSDQQEYTLNQNKITDVTSCSLDTKCGGTGTAKVSSMIDVSTAAEGEERFFKVVVTYSDPFEERTFRFDVPFILEALNNSSTNSNSTVPQSNTSTVPQSNTSNDNTMFPTESPATMLYITTSMYIENGSEGGLTTVLIVILVCLSFPIFGIVIFIIYKVCKRRRFTKSTELGIVNKDSKERKL